MKIAVMGGGPGGLYFSALAKQLGPHHEVKLGSVTLCEVHRHDIASGVGHGSDLLTLVVDRLREPAS